ncbi:hypothetical protein HA402_014400 [Bradysia odoriphaga]|nr:hypothetical protein HA402_014400 [Bradysia odoriphaga]
MVTMDDADGNAINIQSFFNDDEDSQNEQDAEDAENIENDADSGPSNPKPTKQRSGVWAHYREIIVEAVKYAECNLCKKRYKRSGTANGSTGNMRKHLTNKHPGTLESSDDGEEDSAFVFSQESFRKALLKWLVLCDEPFTATQEEAFANLVRTLNPHAKLYSDKTMRADLLDTFKVKLNELRVQMSEVPGKISVTMDGWTSKNVLPFLAIRAHWLDAEWNYKSQLLDFCHIEGSHSGKAFKDLFVEVLQSLEIPLQKIISITVDNVSSNDTFFEELEEHLAIFGMDAQVRCLAHIINLAAQDVLASLRGYHIGLAEETAENEITENLLTEEILDDIDLGAEVNDSEDEDSSTEGADNEMIVVKLRTLVRKIRKSVQLRQKLKKLCKMYQVQYLVPILDVKNRWNSTYDMILRAEHLQIPLRALCSNERKLSPHQITEIQWMSLLEIKHLLQKFHRATQLVSMERHSTISAYLPTLDWLIVSLKSIARGPTGLVHAAREGLAKLQKYESIIYSSKLPFIATFLHPALKLNYFKEHKYPNTKIREIKNMITDYFAENYESEVIQSNEETSPEDQRTADEDELFAHMYKRSKPDKVSSEIQKYLSLPLSNASMKPLEYWRSESVQHEFPKLSKMARDVLPVQSSSVAVERDFSKGAHVVTPTRCSLTSETIRASMFLKSWFSNNK